MSADHQPLAEIHICHALHYPPDAFDALRDCARVLAPDGMLTVTDRLLPEAERDTAYINAFYGLCDPNYRRGYAEYEWRGLFLDAGFSVESVTTRQEAVYLRHLAPGVSSGSFQRLQVLLVQAPRAVKAFLQPRYATTPDALVTITIMTMTGRKR